MGHAIKYINKVLHIRTNTIWGKYIIRLLPVFIVLFLVIDVAMYYKVRNDNYANTDRMARQSVQLQAMSIDKILK